MNTTIEQTEPSQENEEFVRGLIERGAFPDHSAAVNAAFDLFRRQIARERERLGAIIGEADRQFQTGEYTTYDEAGLRDFFEEIKRSGRERLAASQRSS